MKRRKRSNIDGQNNKGEKGRCGKKWCKRKTRVERLESKTDGKKNKEVKYRKKDKTKGEINRGGERQGSKDDGNDK